ncbi:MAG: hemin uptake protein HemP [Planctomycetales bacterium]|jgi:hemin uptake protein HemP
MSQIDDSSNSSGEVTRGESKVEITTTELFRGQTEVLIHHGAETYRLRVTKSGKLVLNK